jgi:hypothetical protein
MTDATAAVATDAPSVIQTGARAGLRRAASAQRHPAKKQKTSGAANAMTSICAPITGSSNGPAAKSTKMALMSAPCEGGFQI